MFPNLNGESRNDTNETILGTYSLHARDITLACDTESGADNDHRGAGTTVAIRSRGNGLASADGRVWIDASGTAVMTCDTACLGIRREDGKQEILAETDMTGQITLRQATPVLSPHIVLNGDGIELGVGPDGVGARIKMTATGITLSFGVSKMEFTASGIKMTVAEVNTLDLNPGGLDVNVLTAAIKAMVQAEVNANVRTSVSAGVMLQESAAMIMIG